MSNPYLSDNEVATLTEIAKLKPGMAMEVAITDLLAGDRPMTGAGVFFLVDESNRLDGDLAGRVGALLNDLFLAGDEGEA